MAAFGDMLLSWVQPFAQAADDFYVLERLMNVLRMWDEAQIFDKNFSDLLKSFISPKVLYILANLKRWRSQGRSSWR